MILLGNNDSDYYYYSDDMVYVLDSDIHFKYFYGSVTKFLTDDLRIAYSNKGVHVKMYRLTGNELYDCQQISDILRR